MTQTTPRLNLICIEHDRLDDIEVSTTVWSAQIRHSPAGLCIGPDLMSSEKTFADTVLNRAEVLRFEGRALLDMVTDKQQFAVPPAAATQATGYAASALSMLVRGRDGELIAAAPSNLWRSAPSM